MDWKGLVEARHKYQKNGDVPLTTRELEKLQKRHPAKTKERRGRPARFCRSQEKQVQEVSTQLDQVRGLTPIETLAEVNPQLTQLQPRLESGEISNAKLVEQFTGLAKAIDWSSIGRDAEARGVLNSAEETLRLIADLAHESRYSPVI
jgi:chromosome segregation ATPase